MESKKDKGEHRQQYYLVSLVTKIRRRYTDTETARYSPKPLFIFFQPKEGGLRTRERERVWK
jgi:hypothetical protein